MRLLRRPALFQLPRAAQAFLRPGVRVPVARQRGKEAGGLLQRGDGVLLLPGEGGGVFRFLFQLLRAAQAFLRPRVRVPVAGDVRKRRRGLAVRLRRARLLQAARGVLIPGLQAALRLPLPHGLCRV